MLGQEKIDYQHRNAVIERFSDWSSQVYVDSTPHRYQKQPLHNKDHVLGEVWYKFCRFTNYPCAQVNLNIGCGLLIIRLRTEQHQTRISTISSLQNCVVDVLVLNKVEGSSVSWLIPPCSWQLAIPFPWREPEAASFSKPPSYQTPQCRFSSNKDEHRKVSEGWRWSVSGFSIFDTGYDSLLGSKLRVSACISRNIVGPKLSFQVTIGEILVAS